MIATAILHGYVHFGAYTQHKIYLCVLSMLFVLLLCVPKAARIILCAVNHMIKEQYWLFVVLLFIITIWCRCCCCCCVRSYFFFILSSHCDFEICVSVELYVIVLPVATFFSAPIHLLKRYGRYIEWNRICSGHFGVCLKWSDGYLGIYFVELFLLTVKYNTHAVVADVI